MTKDLKFYCLTRLINYFLRRKNFEVVSYLLDKKKALAKKIINDLKTKNYGTV